MMRRFATPLAAIAMAAIVATGCGSSSKSTTKSSGGGGSTPAPLKAGGDFLFCTDVPYAPAEYQEGSKFVGYEVDIAKEVAKRLGVTATFQKTGFDGIIAALQSKKCDGIMSSMNSTPERKKQVDFVDYLSVGQSLLIPTASKDKIASLEDLNGKTVAVEVGTTMKDALDAFNKTTSGEKIVIKTYPDNGAAAAAVQGGDVDAFLLDSPIAADFVNKQPEIFTLGGAPIDPAAVGIALRKTDTKLSAAVQKAIDDMYADGSMGKILDTWKIADFKLEGK